MRQDFVQVPGADDRLKPGDLVVALVDDAAAEKMLTLFNTKAST